MSDTLIHDLGVELAHACHDDDKESRYYRLTLTQKDLPYLKDDETVVIEYRRHRASQRVRGVNEYETSVVWAGV